MVAGLFSLLPEAARSPGVSPLRRTARLLGRSLHALAPASARRGGALCYIPPFEAGPVVACSAIRRRWAPDAEPGARSKFALWRARERRRSAGSGGCVARTLDRDVLTNGGPAGVAPPSAPANLLLREHLLRLFAIALCTARRPMSSGGEWELAVDRGGVDRRVVDGATSHLSNTKGVRGGGGGDYHPNIYRNRFQQYLKKIDEKKEA